MSDERLLTRKEVVDECQTWSVSVVGRVTSAAAKEAAIKEKRGQLFSHMHFRVRVAL